MTRHNARHESIDTEVVFPGDHDDACSKEVDETETTEPIDVAEWNAANAKFLLTLTDIYGGDHGFEGAQMEAWQDQRTRYLFGLTKVALSLDMSTEDIALVREAQCPRNIEREYRDVEREVETEHTLYCADCDDDVTHTGITTETDQEEIGEHSDGTSDGAKWADAVYSLLLRAYDNRVGSDVRIRWEW